MKQKKLIRLTTVPISLDKLLEGQLRFMNDHFEVIAISGDEQYLKKITQREGVRYRTLELTRKITPLNDLIAVYKLYRILRDEQPEIIHTHTPKAGIVGMLAGKMARVPLRLHTVAGLPLLETSGLKRIVLNTVERLTYKCATGVYPNAFGLSKIIKDLQFAPHNKLKVIGNGSSNGIDTAYFNPEDFSLEKSNELKQKLGIPQQDFIFVFVGRLVSDKGINELITAFINLAQSESKVSLVLVGPLETDLDPLAPQTLSAIEDHPKIFKLGYQDDVRPYYAFAKALCFPSYREGFPNVVLQAGAMGLPSIVTDINGCNEIVEDGYNGLIIPPKNAEALQKAMEKLLHNESLRSKMSKVSRSKITDNYERKVVHNAILSEYQRLLPNE
ncbi:glycosyltransferase family 1 protein [Dokdonia sinensis]|uniref:Glycosyltransferase family 1 protein n=1 Tax=Dokdonia sinensis TaxID=2479847 RepID=A0A3M0GM94_9FLAO|nr:glycosyltransferase family 4 protein [Dokdonia sinensis]RMB63832.1 glycosyltransferase family 1 protein [Dokdonia sinensis]